MLEDVTGSESQDAQVITGRMQEVHQCKLQTPKKQARWHTLAQALTLLPSSCFESQSSYEKFLFRRGGGGGERGGEGTQIAEVQLLTLHMASSWSSCQAKHASPEIKEGGVMMPVQAHAFEELLL